MNICIFTEPVVSEDALSHQRLVFLSWLQISLKSMGKHFSAAGLEPLKR